VTSWEVWYGEPKADNIVSLGVGRYINCEPHTIGLFGYVRQQFQWINSKLKAIALLTQLVSFNLSLNNFNGSIPYSIPSLTQLDYLDLSINNFTGSIPDSIASLTQLAYLVLSQNSFSGSFPDSIVSLTQLVRLDISNYNFS